MALDSIIKEQFANQDIPWGEGKVAKAGTRLHSLLVGDMIRDEASKHDAEMETVVANVKSAIDAIENLFDNPYVEAVVAKKNGEGFDIELVDNALKVKVKTRLGKNTKEKSAD